MLKSFAFLQSYLTSLLNRDDRGATAVEYGLMVALIAVAIIATVTALGGALNGLFATITASLLLEGRGGCTRPALPSDQVCLDLTWERYGPR